LIFASSFYGRENCQQWKLLLLTIIGGLSKMANGTTRLFSLLSFLATLSHLSIGVVDRNHYCRNNKYRLHEVRVRTGESFVHNCCNLRFSNWVLFCERCRKSPLPCNHRKRRSMTLNARQISRHIRRHRHHVTSVKYASQ
jgi:hypothetical protein